MKAMKKSFLRKVTVFAVITLILASCTKVPQAEIDAANAAIAEAEAAGADLYVHEAYVALQDSMNAVMVTIETQQSKLVKNFSTAKEQLAGVTQYAQEVKTQTEARKEEIKVEIQTLFTEVKALIDTNKVLITEAPKGKEGTTALEAIKIELTAIENTLNEANVLLAGGDYIATLDKAKVAKDKAYSINTELNQVIAKYRTNVKPKKG